MTAARRRLIAAAAALLVGVVVVGCSSDDDRPQTIGSLDPSQTSPSPSPTGTEGMTDKQQIKAIYLNYVSHVSAAEDMRTQRRRIFLARWLTDPALTDHVQGIESLRRAGHRTRGDSHPHVFRTRVSDSTARLNDCSDESHVVEKDLKTGKVVHRGEKSVWFVATLKRTASGWRIARVSVKEAACSAA